MDAYTAFAKVYDTLMENVPYETWALKLDEWIRNYGISRPQRGAVDPLESERNLVLDLGCGTGIMTRLMYDKGYDVMGIDISPEMLDEARKSEDERVNSSEEDKIMYICQDMCEIDLYSTVGTVYSSCDSINYLLEDEEVMNCFSGVSKFLYPGGLFIFDFNTAFKYKNVIGSSVIAENNDDVSFIWENSFDESCNINECDLTLFIGHESGDGEAYFDNLYEKNEEVHYQRGFTITEIRDFLERAGLTVIKEFDEREVVEKSQDGMGTKCRDGDFSDAERIFVIARKDAGR